MTAPLRFTHANPCPVCGGGDNDPRHRGQRCSGFRDSTGPYVHCTREEHAGGLELDQRTEPPSYCHLVLACKTCRCGVEHGGVVATAPRLRRPAANGLGPVVARYVYRDEHGNEVMSVTRHNPKEFRQWRRGEHGDWLSGLNGQERILYHLDELAAARPGSAVWWCEGEKDADRLTAEGLLATTFPGGAGKTSPRAVAALAGHPVAIPADNDEAGRRGAEVVAAALAGTAPVVKVLDLPGLSVGGDVSDWLDAGHTVEELRDLARSAPAWERSGDGLAAAATEEPNRDSVAPPAAKPHVWDDPVPLGDHLDRPAFPVDALPAWSRDWVRAVAKSMQTPVDIPAFALLGALSAATQGHVGVQLTSSWREPANLYLLLVAASGEGKSPPFEAATGPLRTWEADRVKAKGADHAATKAEREVLERRAENFRKQAVVAEAAKVVELLREADACARKAAEIAVPPMPRLLADDVTPEAMAALLADHGGHIAVLTTEGGLFDIIAGRYSSGVPNLDVFLKSFAGEPMRVDRRGGPPQFIERPALTLALAVQPSVIEAMRLKPEMRERGLLARFCFAVPTSMVGARDVRAGAVPVPDDLVARYAEKVKGIASHHADTERTLTLDEDAAELFCVFRGEIERRLGPDRDLHHIADWGSKVGSNVARIAALLLVAETVAVDEVPGRLMKLAVNIGEYLVAHAGAAFGLLRQDPRLVAATRVLVELSKPGWETFTVRRLFSALPRPQFPRVGVVEAALSLLEDHGWVRQPPGQEPRSGRGRPPSPTYESHPQLTMKLSAVSAKRPGMGVSADYADISVEMQHQGGPG